MKSANIIIVLIAATIFCTSCGSNKGSSSKNLVVLLDISLSIKPAVLDWYVATIEKDLCAGLSQFDKIKVLPIDGASQTAARALLDLDLFAFRNEWDVMGLNANETDRLKKEAFAVFIHSKMKELRTAIEEAQVARKEVGNTTDILGALEVAQEKYADGFSNALVIMSDMEQYADKCKMRINGKSTDWLSQTDGMKFNNIGKFTVYVITGEQMAMSKAYYNEIKIYWTEFFAKQGVANLTYHGADASQLKQSLAAN